MPALADGNDTQLHLLRHIPASLYDWPWWAQMIIAALMVILCVKTFNLYGEGRGGCLTLSLGVFWGMCGIGLLYHALQ